MYQLFVIGGGSGGLSCARTAASFGIKVGLADFVKPSPIGTKWGVGGTCVNVGCIPKKLYHQTSLLGQSIQDAFQYGWDVQKNPTHNWAQVRERINDHIVASNKGYQKTFKKQKIQYHNKLAKIISKNKILLTNSQGVKQEIEAKNIVIAVGGRPSYPDIPGAYQYGITSDDIFSLQNNPGKTLVVGASYIALQTAGFLHGLGIQVQIMVRSILLRGFDQQMAEKVGQSMQIMGCKFIKQAVPIQIKLNSENKRVVTYLQQGKKIEQTYDTVIFATGRKADTKGLQLDKVGIKTSPSGKIIAKQNDETDLQNVYALGDAVQGRPELTPSAILAGKMLAGRLFGKQKQLMNYKIVPTTVFTPIQYGTIGYSHQQAVKKYGAQNIISYGSKFRPLQWSLNYQKPRQLMSYAKIVCNKADNQRVVGFHFLGPNAGQVTQGFALGMRLGATKRDFDLTIGIHPTNAEQFTLLKAQAGSKDEVRQGCCG